MPDHLGSGVLEEGEGRESHREVSLHNLSLLGCERAQETGEKI